MSRFAILIVLIAAIAGGLFFLSTQAKEVPTRTIEVEVSEGTDAR